MLAPTTIPYLGWFAVAAVLCIALYYRTQVSSPVPTSPEFKTFQRSFIVVYTIMMMADWMQGPYVYALYKQYGFTQGQIGQLFIAGFGSSLLFGTVVGGFADKYGRKANCLLFAVLYSVGCVTKHFNDYWVLMFGRLMGGISTSILYSAFETWMVHEHKALGFADEWLNGTFSAMTFGSGLSAIVAGLFAGGLSSTFGLVAPFDGSMILLIVGGVVIFQTWRENYGDSSRLSTGFDNFGKAWRLLVSSEKVILLGLVQSCFESAMYIFVFMWTPALEASADGALPHGLIFAIFMVCLMLGSKVFEILVGLRPVEHLSRWVFVVASAALALPILTTNHNLVLAGFCVFEVCCGIYFPSVVRLCVVVCAARDGGEGTRTSDLCPPPPAHPPPPQPPSPPIPPLLPLCRARCAPSTSRRRSAPPS
jgi:MFS transporter, MFS domain-containing protein family, molybdate-anion transporter